MILGWITRTTYCSETDCFAYKEGRCICLDTSDFGRRRCPFFKTLETLEAERKAVIDKLIREGRQDLLEQYYRNRGLDYVQK